MRTADLAIAAVAWPRRICDRVDTGQNALAAHLLRLRHQREGLRFKVMYRRDHIAVRICASTACAALRLLAVAAIVIGLTQTVDADTFNAAVGPDILATVSEGEDTGSFDGNGALSDLQCVQGPLCVVTVAMTGALPTPSPAPSSHARIPQGTLIKGRMVPTLVPPPLA